MRNFACLLSVVIATFLLSCSADKDSAEQPGPATALDAAPQVNLVEIVARGLQFDAPDTTTPGWTTFRLRNESGMAHFALVQKLPDGIGIADHQAQVAPVFQQGLNHLNDNDVDAAMQAFGKLPDWFHQIKFWGGPGLVSGGEVAETTVFLEPGMYLIECYVKTGGVFHSYSPVAGTYGMVAQLEVTGDTAPAKPPEATLVIDVSAANGIEAPAQLAAGRQVVQVNFADQQPHEHFVGHDLHLVALEPDTNMASVYAWMDWRNKTGLQTPAPARFIGGTNEMPAGNTAYLHLDLVPGNYLWIAEVPNPDTKNMARQFVVR